jgi:hypothetical protein
LVCADPIQAVAAAIAASVMAFQNTLFIFTSRFLREIQKSFCDLSGRRIRSGIDGPYLRDTRGARNWIRKKDRERKVAARNSYSIRII